ncbi:hypothetical protein MNBD_GAMMA17-196 [hydrothermal vent metagenome]|uniref:DUF1304 domain-containing protein n=1 Tax=hydrothermal vent metagenome TaxID=652676 RepID=A0A3B0ZL42_9ZZZZ
MSKTAKGLLIYVIAFHLLAFVVEAFFWMNPAVYSSVLKDKDPLVNVDLYEQALILKMLFINQGFYNLMVAVGGILGFVLIAKGKESEGLYLLGYMSLFATVAGIALLFSAHAYAGAILQGVPAALAMFMIYPLLRRKTR